MHMPEYRDTLWGHKGRPEMGAKCLLASARGGAKRGQGAYFDTSSCSRWLGCSIHPLHEIHFGYLVPV